MTTSRRPLLVGLPQISEYVGRDEHTTFILLSRGLLPGFLWSRRWCARPDTLDRFFEALEAENLKKGIPPANPSGAATVAPARCSPQPRATPLEPPPRRRAKRLRGGNAPAP